MYLLEREISPYNNSNLIIGIFYSEKEAFFAKQKYIEKISQNDKWKDQAYKEVNLDIDLKIIDVTDLSNFDFQEKRNLKQLFIINLFEEGFGQIIRKIKHICSNKNESNSLIQKLNEEEPEYEPSWYEVEKIEINKIYFDK